MHKAWMTVVSTVAHVPEHWPDGAHPGQGVDGLEALVDGLGQEAGKLLVVENFQVATWTRENNSAFVVASKRSGGRAGMTETLWNKNMAESFLRHKPGTQLLA